MEGMVMGQTTTHHPDGSRTEHYDTGDVVNYTPDGRVGETVTREMSFPIIGQEMNVHRSGGNITGAEWAKTDE